MRKVVMKDENQMEISTGHAGFDRQTTAIMTGNIYGGTQIGNYIRAYTDTLMPDGKTTCEPGYLQNFDLEAFRQYMTRFPLMTAIQRHGHDTQTNLHMFFSGHGTSKVVHGFVLTEDYTKMHELIGTFSGATPKSRRVIETVAEYVSNPPGTTARLAAAGIEARSRLDEIVLNGNAGPNAAGQRAVKTLGNLETILDVLSASRDGVQIGPRVLQHLIHEDFRIAARTPEEEAAAAEAMSVVSSLDRESRHSLASAITRLKKFILKDFSDGGPDFHASTIGFQAAIKASAKPTFALHGGM